jgi:hypothetical protein
MGIRIIAHQCPTLWGHTVLAFGLPLMMDVLPTTPGHGPSILLIQLDFTAHLCLTQWAHTALNFGSPQTLDDRCAHHPYLPAVDTAAWIL